MSRFALIAALMATTLSAQQPDESFEVEPAILPQNLPNESSRSKSAAPAPTVDLAGLEKDLEHAKKSAATAERLYKIGALAKVEAEARTLKVIRLESDVENARLAQAKEEALSQPEQKEAGPDATKTEGDLARAIQTAHAAAAKREQAELEAAEMNLFRQQKLLALGSGSKANVRRAEQKLTDLKTQKN